MQHSIDVQMLNALEFFHYSYRFQHRLFILSLADDIDLRNIVTDLRVLNAARIRCMVLLNHHPHLPRAVKEWNRRGYPFEFLRHAGGIDFDMDEASRLRKQLEKGRIPVVGLSQSETNPNRQVELEEMTVAIAQHFSVDKVFFLSQNDGLKIDDTFASHLTPQEVQKKLKGTISVNIGQQRLKTFVHANLELGFEIVLLKGESGCLFQEIFTHRGKGTLLTNDYPNIMRKGRQSDVMDIALLLKPYVSSGAILPVTEDAIASEAEAYYVYTVNDSIVAIAKLTDHGSATELAKFCTLPRYQGKGRARELAEKMIQTVKQAEKDYIFALSVEPKMFDFFKSLGFSECDRESLPESWKNQYDMTRKSKAFKLMVRY